MTRIALIGASGQVGSRILKELSDRSFAVTAIARHPESIATLPHVTALKGDVKNADQLTEQLKGHDVVVSSVKFGDSDARTLIEAVRTAGAGRYLVVGGAGSLEVAPGKRLIDLPDFPEAYRSEATRGAEFLDLLLAEKELNWTFISPSAEFVPGERTGVFRLGTNALLSNEQGSRISFEDFALALVNEIEKPAHSRQRFTVGY